MSGVHVQSVMSVLSVSLQLIDKKTDPSKGGTVHNHHHHHVIIIIVVIIVIIVKIFNVA